MNDSLKFVESYSASPKEVWKAITDKVQMKQWYFDSYDFLTLMDKEMIIKYINTDAK